MSTKVSTGQFTIVDHNDAISITSFIHSSRGTSQVFSLNDGVSIHTPNWTEGGYQVLTAYVYAGSDNVASLLTDAVWTREAPLGEPGSASISNGNDYASNGDKLTIKTNILTESEPTRTFYYQGDYNSPFTGLKTHVVALVTLTLTKKGDSANVVLIEGSTVINKSTTSESATCQVRAGLYRNSGIRDTTDVSYRWFKIEGGVENYLNASHSDITEGYILFLNDDDETKSPPSGSNFSPNCSKMVIKEEAVNDIQLFRVEVKDDNPGGGIYGATFVVYDVSDPYDVRINSTAGDKFQNGIGTTLLTPEVKYGASIVDVGSGWSFVWTIYDKDGERSALVSGEAKNISSNDTTSFTVSPSFASPPLANSLIKVLDKTGFKVQVYEVGTGSTTTKVNIKTTGLTNAWVSTTSPTSQEFQNGKLFVGLAKRDTVGLTPITVTGDDIDVKGTIYCEAYKPIS